MLRLPFTLSGLLTAVKVLDGAEDEIDDLRTEKLETARDKDVLHARKHYLLHLNDAFAHYVNFMLIKH